MDHLEDAFGRLEAAWLPVLNAGRTPLVAPGSIPFSKAVLPEVVNVLVVTLAAEPVSTAPMRNARNDFEKTMAANSHYAFSHLVVSNLAALEPHLRDDQPNLLVIDEGLLRGATTALMNHLHRRMPSIDWLVAWDAPVDRSFALAIRSKACGGIEWCASAERIELALKTVRLGEVWFPRRMTKSLYFALLCAQQSEAGVAELPSGPGSLDPTTSNAEAVPRPLTDRETEALTLMRRGLTNKQIGERLGISVSTVKKHLEHSFVKLGLHNRRQMLG